MDINQLGYFKHLPDETKLLIFNILRELSIDVHPSILTILDQHEELRIVETIKAEYDRNEYDYEYSSSECSDPEEEYQRRLIKQFNDNWWHHNYSGNETD